MYSLRGQGRIQKHMSWYFYQIFFMEKLAIVNESHNIINIIYDAQSLQTVVTGGIEWINPQYCICMGATGVMYVLPC